MGDEASSDDVQLLALLVEREAAVDSLLRAGSTADALRRALADPPFVSKNAALKDRSSAVAHRCIVALGSRDEAITGFFANVDPDAADALMKCESAFGRREQLAPSLLSSMREGFQKALEQLPNLLKKGDARALIFANYPLSLSHHSDIVKGLAHHGHSALYLKFHALVVERCGVACVVRTIVDRKMA